MKVPFRKGALLLISIFLLLPVAAYWLADTWLESSGGRQMLERTLSEKIGMRVRLDGEFDLMLLPDIGVSGTALVVGGPDQGSEFFRSEEFEISVALQPLLDRKVLIEWIRLTGGYISPEHYSRTEPTVGAASAANLFLPEINELSIRDFQFLLPGEEASPLQVRELKISGFAENRETPFSLEIEDLLAIEGKLLWDAPRSLIHFGNLRLLLGEQVISGAGCLFLQTPVSLHLDLQAGVFDLDAFREGLPGTGSGVSGGGSDLPFEIRARLSAGEIKTSGAVAHGVVFSMGEAPACD